VADIHGFFLFFSARLPSVLYGSRKLISTRRVLPFCNLHYLFTLSFLSKQTRHGRNIVSFYFFLFICGRAKCLSREQCVGSSARVDSLCNSCSLQKHIGDQQLCMKLDDQC